MKVVFWTVFPCGVVCVKGGLYGLYIRVRMFGVYGLKFQPDTSSVRNIFEASFTEEVTGSGKAIFVGGFTFVSSESSTD